jgi:hypothetical protein
VEYSFEVQDGVWSFQDSRVCDSVELLLKVMILSGEGFSSCEVNYTVTEAVSRLDNKYNRKRVRSLSLSLSLSLTLSLSHT